VSQPLDSVKDHPFEELYAPFRDIPLFSGLEGDTLLVFYIAAREIIARPGETIVREGDAGEELFIIGRGKVKVLVGQGHEHETLVATLGPKDFFGEMCVIEPTSRSATIIAEETAFLYGLKSTTLNKNLSGLARSPGHDYGQPLPHPRRAG
jgi:CRP-like cAMP-binding protein